MARIETNLIKRDKIKRALRNSFRDACHGRYTSEVMNARYLSITGAYRPYPQWVAAYIDGYRDALQESLYASALVHGGYVRGEFYATDSRHPRYYRKHGIDSFDYCDNATDKGFYWREDATFMGRAYPGKIAPWFISE